ncbi:MAG: hypothetical protein Q8Q09_10120 [Deltaproteobacteria bacterium]|nr:hypothetical protein [Deltaproteobacteria bacterium]
MPDNEQLLSARVAVVGLREHGTSEVVEGLRALITRDRVNGVIRRLPTQSPDDPPMIFNDFGPRRGAPSMHSLKSGKRPYALWECVDGVESLLFVRGVPLQGVLWVIAAEEPLPGRALATEMLACARVLGAETAVIYLHEAHSEAGARALNNIEYNARRWLNDAGFEGDHAVLVRGTGEITPYAGLAWQPGIAELWEQLDIAITYRKSEDDRLWLSIADPQMDLARPGVAASTMIVRRGVVEVGDAVDLLGPSGRRSVRVCEMTYSGRPKQRMGEGEAAVVMLEGIGQGEISRADVVVGPGQERLVSTLRAIGFACGNPDATDPRTRAPMARGELTLTLANGAEQRAEIVSVDEGALARGASELVLQLSEPLVLDVDMVLHIRSAKRVVAMLRVTELLSSLS